MGTNKECAGYKELLSACRLYIAHRDGEASAMCDEDSVRNAIEKAIAKAEGN